MPDPVAVNSMFARIAHRYDVANRLLSGGADVRWRRILVSTVAAGNPSSVLDLATGSGDVAFALARGLPASVAITGMDFCLPMLDEARAKQSRLPGAARIRFEPGDGLALPLDDDAFDAVTISFGLRNMADRHRSLTEMNRVLRPGGQLHVLEFSQPVGWFRPLYYAYLKFILPTIASAVTRDRGAYEYLCGSIESYPNHRDMTEEIRRAGFRDIRVRRLSLGIVALHSATK